MPISLSFRTMRSVFAPALVLVSLIAAAPRTFASAEPSQPPVPHGLTVQEEAKILALEDRRAWDPALGAAWASHPNSLHRQRIALAIARIGPHSFIDTNGNGKKDGREAASGTAELIKLATDADRNVRLMAAFALGETADHAGVQTLLFLTGDSDPAIAAEAAEALSKIGATDEEFNVDRYVWMLDARYPEAVRARAARFLFRFADRTADTAALKHLPGASPLLRQELAYTMARRETPPAREALQLLLTDPNVLTRVYAAAGLGRIAHAASTDALVAALGDIHPWVRTNAAVAIAKIGAKGSEPLVEKHLPRIFAAAEDPDPGVRASMVEVLGWYAAGHAEARARLTSVLKNGSQWERELAAGAIARQFAPDGEPFRKLGELTPWQVVRVIEATAEERHGRAIRKQYAAHPEAMVRAAVLSAIPEGRVDAEIELVNAGFDDRDVVVRAAAYDRFGAVQRGSADEWLSKLRDAERRERKEKMNDGRIAAIQAAAKLDWPARRGFLQAFLRDTDPVIRRVAADEIAKYYKGEVVTYAPLPVSRRQSHYEEIVRWSRTPHTATIHMTRGRIEVALLAQDAPMTAWNFARLARDRFFDNSTFMRVVPNFVVQGGDPRNDMSGGPGYAIRDEINAQKYTRGAVGMALSGPDTGGSQFFIAHSPQPHLDGGYTVFGRVYEGMSGVVDQIERGDRVQRITIDERPPAGAEKVAAVPNVSLPLQVGKISAEQLLATVPEYRERRDAYTPDVTVLEMIKSHVRADDRMEVYLGTWCDDSQREVPKLLRVLDDLRAQFGTGIPVAFFALDRSKQEPAELLKGKSITRLSTFLYLRGGKEIGRIEERPEGLMEDALLTILAGQAPAP